MPLRAATTPPSSRSTAAVAPADIEAAGYGVTLARYGDRDVAAASWSQYVARFPRLGAAESRVIPMTAADGATIYLLQGAGLTERQAAAICDEMRQAEENCAVLRL